MEGEAKLSGATWCEFEQRNGRVNSYLSEERDIRNPQLRSLALMDRRRLTQRSIDMT